MNDNQIFDGGCFKIVLRDDNYFIRHDTGETAGSVLVDSKISQADAFSLQRCPQDALRLMMDARIRNDVYFAGTWIKRDI